MKRIVLTLLLILPVCFASISNTVVSQGQTDSDFGDYKIVKLEDHLTLNGKELDKYLISYDRPDMKVIVAVDKQKKCKNYYVISGNLAVQYKCNGKIFGIMKLNKKFHSKGLATSPDNLNKEEFKYQRVVTSGVTRTIDHLNLIAAYYPKLINQKVSWYS